MNSQSLYEEEILALIATAWDAMTVGQREYWEEVSVVPEKWTQENALLEDFSIGGEDFNDNSLDEDDFHRDSCDEYDLDEVEIEDVGFWVVAIVSKNVLWYNHNVAGFNISPYRTHGKIDRYGYAKDELEVALQKVMLDLTIRSGN